MPLPQASVTPLLLEAAVRAAPGPVAERRLRAAIRISTHPLPSWRRVAVAAQTERAGLVAVRQAGWEQQSILVARAGIAAPRISRAAAAAVPLARLLAAGLVESHRDRLAGLVEHRRRAAGMVARAGIKMSLARLGLPLAAGAAAQGVAHRAAAGAARRAE